MTGRTLVVTWSWGLVGGGYLQRGTRELLGVTELFYSLSVMVAAQWCTCYELKAEKV